MLATLALALLAATEIIRGSVVDPVARPIAGARIELTCHDVRVTVSTDAAGSFALAAPGPGPCSIRASYSGFRETTLTVAAEQAREPVTIHLALEPWDERVEVRASPPGLAAVATGAVSTSALGPDTLNIAGPDAWRWLHLAERAAGQPPGTKTLGINGLPADGPPPSDLIATIGVGADPFGAEVTGADRVRVEVATEPGRRWHFAISPGMAATRQHDLLMPSASRESQGRAASVGGPLNRTGTVRAFAAGSSSHVTSQPTYVEAAIGGDRIAAGVSSTTGASGWTTGLSARRNQLSVNAMVSASRLSVSNGGVGGRTGPSGAMDLETSALRLQTTWRYTGTRLGARGGFSAQRQHLDSSVLPAGPGVMFADRLLHGSPDTLALAQTATSWRAQHIVESPGTPARPWLAGVDIAADHLREDRTFNPEGVVFLAAPTAQHGAWVRRTGTATHGADARLFAVFGQRVIANSSRVWSRAGARAEWQPGAGVTIAPRVAIGVRAGQFLVGANLGVFSDLWPAASALEYAFRAGAPVVLASQADRTFPITLTGSPARRTDLVMRMSAVRIIGHTRLSVEETLTLGRDLAGLTRQFDGQRLIDTLDHSRSMQRSQTRVRVDAPLRGWLATAHYEYAHALDDTDGPFALPAKQNGLADEWGPSTGIARHALTALVTGKLPEGIRVLISARVASGLPYSLLTGSDPDSLFTFTGRPSARRNQQRLPASSDVAAYLAKSFRLPRTGLRLDSGLRLENIFGTLTPLEVERATSSAVSGRPVSAAGGRAVSVWTTIARR